jgi:signal transduction histidine kinase
VLHFAFPLTAIGILALGGFTIEFVGLRIGVRLWRHWNRLRQTHLRWALTHAHLVVVVLGVGTLGTLLFGLLLRSPGSLPLRVLPALFMLAILTVVALAAVLPPSALFSYLFARRTTRRLEVLTSATNQLSAGDYRVRVPVDGADEVAQLQTNFNAMAADLERTVAELQRERDRVALLLLARRELVASVSHELRTPLATLRGYLESALTHWDTTPPDTLRHDLGVMDRETGHLQTLINDLFTLARAEVGKLELRSEPIDVGQVVRHVVEVSSPAVWQSSRIQLLAEADANVPLVLADARRVQQILHNLVHNATRHTPPGGIVVVEARAEDNQVALEVKDTGEGICADELPLIWQRFYRGQGARQHPEGSSGLGLALVKELTEAMGGAVAVTSTLGEGSVFTVRLPRALTAPEGERPGRALSPRGARVMPRVDGEPPPEPVASANASVA